MKKNQLIATMLLGLCLLPGLTLAQGQTLPETTTATVWQDLYYSRQEKKDLTILIYQHAQGHTTGCLLRNVQIFG